MNFKYNDPYGLLEGVEFPTPIILNNLDTCDLCNGTIIVHDCNSACSDCGKIFDSVYENNNIVYNKQVKMPKCLFQLGCEEKQSIYSELLKLNKEFSGKGFNPFPRIVLKDVADKYSIIQQKGIIKR